MPTRLFSSRVTPPASVRLFFLYPHKVGPDEGVARGQLEEDRRRALWDFLEGRSDALFNFVVRVLTDITRTIT
jgi:hypothetical protein